MKRFALLALTFSALAAALPPVQAQAAQAPVVKDWDVFVDLPTGFAFVKTPLGWKFVRQLDDEQMARLPATTLTSLLPVDDDAVHYAHPALEPSPRVPPARAAQVHFADANVTRSHQ